MVCIRRERSLLKPLKNIRANMNLNGTVDFNMPTKNSLTIAEETLNLWLVQMKMQDT